MCHHTRNEVDVCVPALYVAVTSHQALLTTCRKPPVLPFHLPHITLRQALCDLSVRLPIEQRVSAATSRRRVCLMTYHLALESST